MGLKLKLYCNVHKKDGMINVKVIKCEHDKRKSYCKECGGVSICRHNRHKSHCKECGGSQICEHNRQYSRCKECGGRSICKHNRAKSHCKECGGASICSHNRQKSHCKECGGASICSHNRVKSQCILCGGGTICEHNKRKSQCKDCNGTEFCNHNKRKSHCKECGGSQICKHNKCKSYCKECGGSLLCKSSWCETRANPKYERYCLNCFIHLFPDQPNTRNYKTKERAVVEYVFEQFPEDKYTWNTDKRIQDGCSRKRPDVLLDLGYQIIIVEVDENQHIEYDCSCENKRLMLLSQDVGHRPIIFIRFNPDEYITKDKKITSCWGLNGKGICTIKKTKQKEWDDRLESLKTQIEYWINPENKTDKTIEVVQLFYDGN